MIGWTLSSIIRRVMTDRTTAAPPTGLRARILAASAALVETEGLAALSMREVARRAGVTHQAPYHHFADRESILAELVGGGFAELADRLQRAVDRALPRGPRAVVAAAGHAYVGFALDRPGLFRVMFRPEVCDHGRFPAAQAAGERAFGQLLRMVALVHGEPTLPLASMHWAQVHGLASLLLDGGLSEKLPSMRQQRAHARQTVEAYADRFGRPAPVAPPAVG